MRDKNTLIKYDYQISSGLKSYSVFDFRAFNFRGCFYHSKVRQHYAEILFRLIAQSIEI